MTPRPVSREAATAMILYLASTSPRRSALLRAAGIDFVVVEPGSEPTESGVPATIARDRAIAKARGATLGPGAVPGVVLGVDTVVDLDGQELGKPRNAEHARSMLARLAGRDHRVHTGVALVAWPSREVVVSDVATALVRFAPLDDQRLDAHVALGLHAGKAGAYGIQDPPTAAFARVLEGELDTVIGLPVDLLCAHLSALGFGGWGR
ncbi:MAG: Maf family protein [Planctomycetota bacterium]